MRKRYLFIGGGHHGVYNCINEYKNKIELAVYPKIDFKKLFGIVVLNTQPTRTEVYLKKRFGNKEVFCLKGMTDDEIIKFLD